MPIENWPMKNVDLDDYEVVEVTDNAVIVTQLEEAPRLGLEIGRMHSSWTTYLREEYNGELRGTLGLRTYDRMRRSDSAIRGSLRTLKAPITGANWYTQPADARLGEHSPEEIALHKEIADFVHLNLLHIMTYPWRVVLREALLMLDFGYYMFEKVWGIREFDGVPRVYLQKLAPRHPIDVEEWKFDANGGPSSVVLYGDEGSQSFVEIPIDKLAIFTFDGEAGDIRGMSVLRSAYKHWYFKENAYKIDAIQKERHGIGIPVIKLPLGFTPTDKAEAIELASNLRANEKAHAVLPPGWEVMFAKLEGQPVSALETAEHHSRMIYQNVLAQAMWSNSSGGNAAGAEEGMDLFYKSTRQIAEDISIVMNSYVIPQLVRFNWDVDIFPELRVRKLGDTSEARELSFALRNLTGAGVVQVDDTLELWAREQIDAPPHDPTTLRIVESPQQAQSGPPRQSTAPGMRNDAGSSRTGDDGDGK